MRNADEEEGLSQHEPTSIFPISNAPSTSSASTPGAVSGWLHNPSFTVDLSVVQDAVSRFGPKIVEEDYGDDDGEQKEDLKPSTSEEFLGTSETNREERDIYYPEDAERQRGKRKSGKKKKKRKINADYDATPLGFASRKSSLRAWAGSSETKPSKDYYFDSRGDPDNLAFGSLYRIDVARYKLYDSGKRSERKLQAYALSSRRGLIVEGETDIDALDSKLKSSGRYWSAKYAALERHKNLKRVRILASEKPQQVVPDDFICLSDQDSNVGSILGTTIIEESWEDEVLRRTKEFNKLTREHPHNVQGWLDFQSARLQTLEKKISILEKATELNPDNEDLLLLLMKAYQGRDNTDIIIGRWEKILIQHPENCKLWREFLHVLQGEFSTFKVSEQRRMYMHAIHALSAACRKRQRQYHPAFESPCRDTAVIELELGVVDLFLSLCRFEWQAGYQELATALFQAEVEYSLFCPSLQLTDQSKRRLFEHFWNSDGARVGEDGALGWSTWLEKEEEYRQEVIHEMPVEKDEEGGWTGWFVPSTKSKENSANSESIPDDSVVLEEITEEAENEDVNQEDDNVLLKMLGIDIDVEASGDIKDSATWARWSEEESLRDQDQWMPLRVKSAVSHSNSDVAMDVEGEQQLSRAILFEDVSEYLFSLRSSQAKVSLVSQFIDFFGGEISQNICTNSASWTEKILCLEDFPNSFLQDLRRVRDTLTKGDCGASAFGLELLLHSPNNNIKTNGVAKFLRNAMLLCLTVFPRNYSFEEAALIAEEQCIIGSSTSLFTATPCQALARRLLKSDRQNVLLCGVYARREIAFGNIEHGRKVFDMALSSVDGLPLESRSILPLLYFWYVDTERANSSGSSESETRFRILHILCCLGCGIAYTPYKCQPTSMQLLRAHQGFKERLLTVRSSWTCGAVDDSSIALVCSAALFEELTAGWAAGVKVVAEALAMVLPETKSRSCQFEYLFSYYVRMIQKHHEQAKLPKMLHSISQGLLIYPFNPLLFRSLIEFCSKYTVPNRLRQILDNHCRKKPSVVVWLFALSFEVGRGSLQHSRIHGLFERALADDRLRSSVILWRCYIAYEIDIVGNLSAAKRIFFRAIHACPWSKKLWLDGFLKLNSVLTAKELSDLQEVMRDKELNLRTDIYEILLQDDFNHG
ncbi:hypothetical protein Nepgr_013844 [Nepenthes gracilis]|uniref:Protein NRDE2 homolog n=1 Tax=Nepenthes gracilis TaxID=150966 RepID=A0AAD3SII5_NEPGR|nr:hypothetical protein Nepgr_013844 [Nepenthes gracilis]